jgi:hypothetical protein
MRVNEPDALFLNDGFLDARHFEGAMGELLHQSIVDAGGRP